MHHRLAARCVRFTRLAAVVGVLAASAPMPARAQGSGPDGGTANDGPGVTASWTTGNKLGVGTSATATSKVWFTIAKGITTEVFYPRLDVPNMQDMQFIVSDGATFVDLERDATNHVISMPDERSLEFTVTNTDTRNKPRYRITSTYLTDPTRNTLLIRTRFQSLDGGKYSLYLLENPSMAGGGGHDTAWWDATNSALMSSDTQQLFGSSPTSVVSALEAASPNGFVAHSTGFSGQGSDCLVDLRKNRALKARFDQVAGVGNIVQCGQIGGIGLDTTFTVALGFGEDAASAVTAAKGSLKAGFAAVEAAYRSGWHTYLTTAPVKPAPASVTASPALRQAYSVALMALHAAEDKTFSGANVAGFATPWGDSVNGDALSDGYHRVWGRDLFEQATGLIAAGDSAQARRMAQFMWDRQFIATPTQGDGTTYEAGSFPRYTPVSGVQGATAQQLGCCEQLDQAGFAMVLAWMTGLTDLTTYGKIKAAANHLQAAGPKTTERWEEQFGESPSSTAAEVAGLVAAADIARQNGDAASAATWEATARSWAKGLPNRTLTHTGTWGGDPGHGAYFERIEPSDNPDDQHQLCFQEGCFWERDVVDFGFLELVRLGLVLPSDATISGSLGPTAQAGDANSTVQVTIPRGGNTDIYFHRYNHDSYGESNTDGCSGWPAGGPNRYGRLWPVLSGERGEFELASGRSAGAYLQSMADAANEGHFVPEQIWDRADVSCFALGRPTGSAAPLNWAEGQYLRLAQAIEATYDLATPSVVKALFRGAGPIAGVAAKCITAAGSGGTGAPVQLSTCTGGDAQRWTWSSDTGTLQALGRCLDVTGGATANGTKVQLWDCNGTGAQEWRWRSQTSLVNPQSGRCLEVAAASTADGTPLQIQECKGSAAQAWHLP